MGQEHWKQWKDSNGTAYNVFKQTNLRFSIRDAIVPDVIQGKAPIFGFDLLPSHPDLVDVDMRLVDFIGRASRFHDAFMTRPSYNISTREDNVQLVRLGTIRFMYQ